MTKWVAAKQFENKEFNLPAPATKLPVRSTAPFIYGKSIQSLTKFPTTNLSSLQFGLNVAGMPRASHSAGWILSMPGKKIANGQPLCPSELAEGQNRPSHQYTNPIKSMQPFIPEINNTSSAALFAYEPRCSLCIPL